jgi:protein phosphatase
LRQSPRGKSPSDAPHWTGTTALTIGERRITIAAGTDRGPARPVNEDLVVVLEDLCAVLVLDGMGGAAAGVTAAQVAADTLELRLRAGDPPEAALVAASAATRAAAASRPELAGLGSAAIVAILGESGVTVAHVGDCRATRLRAAKLTPMTHEHTLLWYLEKQGATPDQVAEARERFPNVISQALGMAEPTPERADFELAPGDRLVLVTDGVHDRLSDDKLAELVRHDDAVRAIELVIAAVNQAAADDQGADNASIVIISVA